MTRIGTDAADGSVILLDTSAAIALLVADHELHDPVVKAIGNRQIGLAGHAWFETFSVLTRLPPGKRQGPRQALELMRANFTQSMFLKASAAASLGPELADRAIAGGQVWDALIAAAARQAGTRLLTADARARSIYEALNVPVEFVGA